MSELKTIFDICKKLQNTSSTIEKQNLLKEHEDNELFKQVLKFLLDKQIVTGISKKKIDKKINFVDTDDLKTWTYDIRNLLSYLEKHNTGTDKDIVYCQRFLNYDNALNDFIKSIITKSLKLGIDVKTVNKVYGRTFIPVLDVMLGTSIEKCKIPQNTWFAITQKLNGSRCFYYKGKLYTRQGKVFTSCEHIIRDVEAILFDMKDELVIDGELILNDSSLSDSEAFQKGVGIANSDKETKEELKLVIFDIIPVDEFENGISELKYKERSSILNKMSTLINLMELTNIGVVTTFYNGTNQNEIWKWLEYAEKHDMEGIMLNLDAPYECKRTKNLIKVKKFYTFDLEVVDVIEGDGRLKGTLGALVVDYKGNKVNVGTGFSDEQRKEFWSNRDNITGRVIEVKYKEITKNKDTGLESLQFPVFMSLREMGKEISYN